MHLIVPFAASASPACREAMARLELPQLRALLARLQPVHTDRADESTLTPPHERALARALGLPQADGCLPWAAWSLRAAGGKPGSDAWAWITPCHWHVATDHVALDDPAALMLDEPASRALLADLAPWFATDGITLQYEAPTRWLARGEVFRNLPCASLDRVIGRNLDTRSTGNSGDPQAAPLRRLQSEMQMLLYTHPFNDTRTAQRLPDVNSFWVSGAGALPADLAPPAGPPPELELSLRDAALRDDAPAWTAAWQALDASRMADLLARAARGEPVTLTLCGETAAVTLQNARRGLFARFKGLFGLQPPSTLIEAL